MRYRSQGPLRLSPSRGSIPVDQTTGRLNSSDFRKNDYYKSPDDYQREFNSTSTSSSESLSQQALEDSGLANPLSHR